MHFYFLDEFTHLKDMFGAMLRLAPDALHIHVGIAVFFIVALWVRGPRRFVTAFWVVLAVAVAAEVFDLLYDLQVGRRLRWMNSAKDIVNAMIWPTAWMLFGSRVARLMRPEATAEPASAGSATGERFAGEPASSAPGVRPPVSAANRPERAPQLEGAGK